MEILSIGEKIKRARVYKGYTLKDICGDFISISKMSCIENNKIKPDNLTLAYISKKLNMDLNYLGEDIDEQLTKNTELIKNNKNIKDYEKWSYYNLGIAEEYGYHDISIQLVHDLFNYYMDLKQLMKIELIVTKYYGIVMKANSLKYTSIFNIDMGRYLFENEEYQQAICYYDMVRYSLDNKEGHENLLLEAVFYEAKSYYLIKDYKMAKATADEFFKLEDKIQNNEKKALYYRLLAVTSIKINMDDFCKYENFTVNLFHNKAELIKTFLEFAEAFFEISENDRAMKYIDRALDLLNDMNKEKYVEFLLRILGLYMNYGIINKAMEICEDVLNQSITMNNPYFIEKTYYYKAQICCHNNDFIGTEMYMNLSLDFLLKNGTKKEINRRYMEMGGIYHRIGNINDSLRCISMAITEKK